MITPIRLIPGSQLTRSYAQLYVLTNTSKVVVKSILLCNNTSTAQTASVQIRPANALDTFDCTILNTVTLQPYETKSFDLTEVLLTGYTIYGKAGNGSAVSITASGMEIA